MDQANTRLYSEINTQLDNEVCGAKVQNNKLGRIFLWRQILISTAVWTNYFTLGLCIGSPTVIIPQWRRDANSTDVISNETASWLSSSYSYSGMVLVVILTILPRYIGRKTCFLLVSAVAMCGFILLYFCKTITQLLISSTMHGVLTASQITISVMIITEYSSPAYRGIFLTTKSASFLWGVWVANTIGTFFHWKYIALVGCVSTAYIIITVLIWPESPFWLASKGRFDECASAHHWLKGDSLDSHKELDDLVNFHRKSQTLNVRKGNKITLLKNNFEMISKHGFYKPLLLSMLVSLLYNSLGKMACTVYAFDIMKKLMNSNSGAYTGMLVLDGISIIGAYVGSGVSKLVKRRSFILLTSAVGVVFLYLLSLFMYLVNANVLDDNMYISFFLLAAYSLVVCSGPVIMASSLISEFIPVTNRTAFALIIGVFGNFCFASFLKITPYLFSWCGFSGSFLVYAVLSSIFIILLYILLPETKDKTLLEIESLLTGKK